MPWTARTAIIVSFVLLGCEQPAPPPAEATLVRALGVQMTQFDRTAALTGEIQARHESNLGFRVGGKVIERLVDVGDTVAEGDLLARLDSQDQQNALKAAQSDIAAAQAVHRAEPDAGGAPAQTSRRWLYDQDPVRQRPAALRSGTGRTGWRPGKAALGPGHAVLYRTAGRSRRGHHGQGSGAGSGGGIRPDGGAAGRSERAGGRVPGSGSRPPARMRDRLNCRRWKSVLSVIRTSSPREPSARFRRGSIRLPGRTRSRSP